MVVKVVGIVLLVFGLVLLLTNVTGLLGTWVMCLIGLGCMALGFFFLRGGQLTL
jgi:hypothetical protein